MVLLCFSWLCPGQAIAGNNAGPLWLRYTCTIVTPVLIDALVHKHQRMKSMPTMILLCTCNTWDLVTVWSSLGSCKGLFWLADFPIKYIHGEYWTLEQELAAVSMYYLFCIWAWFIQDDSTWESHQDNQKLIISWLPLAVQEFCQCSYKKVCLFSSIEQTSKGEVCQSLLSSCPCSCIHQTSPLPWKGVAIQLRFSSLSMYRLFQQVATAISTVRDMFQVENNGPITGTALNEQ